MNKFFLMAVISLLSGCSTTSENMQSNSTVAGLGDTVQSPNPIKITAVTSIKLKADNAQAQFAAAQLAALTRGIGGRFGGVGSLGTAGTTIDGGTLGNSTGLMIPDKVLVDGVSITYLANEKMFTTAQPGRACDFQPGSATLLSDGDNETRVQSNARCQTDK